MLQVHQERCVVGPHYNQCHQRSVAVIVSIRVLTSSNLAEPSSCAGWHGTTYTHQPWRTGTGWNSVGQLTYASIQPSRCLMARCYRFSSDVIVPEQVLLIRGFFLIPWIWGFWQSGNNHVNNQSSHWVAPCSGTVYSRKYPQQVVQHCSLASVQCSDVHFVHIVSKQKQATKLCFSWKCSVGACEDEKCLLIFHQPEYYLCTSVICISPCIETSVPLKVKIKYHLDWEVCIQFTSTS